ncbi:hypothetical protein [Streptomyces sp. NPDC051577]|uniref:hypothetical protein n=1 Tax=Streptomyces sp. NPDC051577 TaxID=3155166 RepID=UPI0034499C75
MLERAYRKLVAIFPALPDGTIPLFWPAQTETLSVLSVMLRFGSVLTGAAIWAVLQGAASEEVLLMVAPAAFADRSAVMFQRLRRS